MTSFLLCLLASTTAAAQPAGWANAFPFSVTENSGAPLTGYQLQLTIDTAALVAGGQLRADAADLRFGDDVTGATLLDYWIESGINTAATVVWVRIPSLPASATSGFFMFTGNPAAASASTLAVFDFVSTLQNSATLQTPIANTGGVPNSQRGIRFRPNEDILLTELGKMEPTGSTRYITLFDFATQAILLQQQISGPAAQYTYTPVAQPLWLRAGTQYLLEMYQGPTDGYYFGPLPVVNPKITFLDMRFCNACSQNTFPTFAIGATHYGYSDFEFRTRKFATPAPTVAFGAASSTTGVSGAPNPSNFGAAVTFTATLSALFAPTGSITFQDGAANLCVAVALVGAQATCTTSALTTGPHTISAVYSGDANNLGSAGAASQTVAANATTTALVGAPNPSNFGAPVTFTATVTATSAPTGSVTFKDGAANLCVAVALAGTQATCTTSALATGAHTISAVYSGDANNLGSTGTKSQTVASVVTTFSGPSATGSGTIAASFTGGGPACTFMNPQFIGSPPGAAPIPPTLPAPSVVFPHGMFEFAAASCVAGSTLTFTIVYPANLPSIASYWKYGPTAGNPAPHWYVLPATIVGNTATFSITDGGLGDDDLVANGAIVDQGGPGGGPVAAAMAVPTLGSWALMLLALLLLGFAWRRPGSP